MRDHVHGDLGADAARGRYRAGRRDSLDLRREGRVRAAVAGPYRGDSKEEVELNIQSAKQVGKLCADKGWYPIIPHQNTAGFEILCPKLTDDFWLEGTLEAARRCDAMVLCPGWEFSTGSRGEQLEAIRLKIQSYLNVTEVPNA